MAMHPPEGAEDLYPEGHALREVYQAGREARMEGVELRECERLYYQPHDATKKKAWEDGWRDEDTWALDSTGR